MYKIIDNFLPKETQDELEKALTSYKYSMSVGTVYEEYRNSLPFLKTLPKSEVIQFESKIVDAGSCIFPDEEEIYFRQIWNVFVKENIRDVVCNLSTSDDLRLIRMKSNVLLQQKKRLFGHIHHTPHIDCEKSEGFTDISCIYYVNDSDGPTVLYNEYSVDNPKKLTVFKKIPPKKGRLLAFHSNRYHTSSSPRRSQYRNIINMVFMPKQY
tara:strand:- start:502 stop:1134 length:633 start_codon:yes stop_codon:yes gene_type:complete